MNRFLFRFFRHISLFWLKAWFAVLSFVLIFAPASTAQLKEPYRPVHGGSYRAPAVSLSPDPLIRYRWDHPKAGDSLEIYQLTPQKIKTFPASSFKVASDGITVLGPGDLLVDFGVESAGWLEFDSDDLQDSVTASISEYNQPAIVNAGAEHRIKTRVPVKYGHTYRLELNKALYEGVRFGWIHVNNFSHPWHLKNIRLICQIKPTNYQGSFSCSDSGLTRIWYTGAYTVKLNLLQDYFGAILMERSDRRSWTGDAYPSQAASLAAFGNDDMVRQNLFYTSSKNNGIAAYSLYWVLSLVDYYDYTGDSTFLRGYVQNADKRLEEAFRRFDNLPPLEFMGWDERLGAGFENPGTAEAAHTYRMLCIHAWRQFARAMSFMHEEKLAAKYRRMATLKARQIEGQPNLVTHFGVHALAEAVLAGLGSDTLVARLSRKSFADRLQRLSYSPFNQFFIIQAMARAGQYQDALGTIRDCWGGQIKYGGTTFFEVYRPSWNAMLQPNDPPPNNQCGPTSLCHPWSAGVTQWLSEHILGIRPLTPGFQHFSIVPHLAGELTWVKGDMPTPHGPITAAFNILSGVCSVRVPVGTSAREIALPTGGRPVESIRMNGRVLMDTAFHPGMGIGGMRKENGYVYLSDVKPGQYSFRMTFSGDYQPSRVSPGSYHYRITSFGRDSLTSGNWKRRYGRDGYMLLGDSSTAHAKKLPSYVDSVTFHKEQVVVWDTASTDTRVPEAPVRGKRTAAAITTRDPWATYQTMTIDVRLKEDHPCRISLYFLDWGDQGRSSAVELFNLDTLDMLAPVKLVHYEGAGRYLSFTVHQSVRIRIDQVRGKNAAVSGLFFDQP